VTDSSKSERQGQLRAQYEAEQHAAHYAERRWTESAHARATHAWEMQHLGALLDEVGPFQRTLDLPCGHGRLHELLAPRSERLVQGDLAAAMLAQRRVAEDWSLQASLLDLPFADDCVDLAVCFRVLHHFPEAELRARAIAELGRVSSRYVLTSYYDASSFPERRDRIRGRKRTLTACRHEEFEREAASAQMKVRRRIFRRRFWSQQVIVLLERTAAL